MQQCSVLWDNSGVLDGGLSRGDPTYSLVSAQPGVLGKTDMILHIAWNNRTVSHNQ